MCVWWGLGRVSYIHRQVNDCGYLKDTPFIIHVPEIKRIQTPSQTCLFTTLWLPRLTADLFIFLYDQGRPACYSCQQSPIFVGDFVKSVWGW